MTNRWQTARSKRWKELADYDAADLQPLLRRIRLGTESWIQKLWSKITRQVGTRDIVQVHSLLQRAMESTGSCIYILANFRVNCP